MNPEDDPEKRIRELERPLTDVARSAELGTAPLPPPTAGWTPPPPPPGYYGPPMPPPVTSQSSSSGMRVGWVLLGLLVLGLVVGGGAIVAGNVISSSTRSALNTPTTPGIPGGGGPFTPPTRASAPTFTAAPAEPPTSATTVEQPAPGERLSVSGISENKTLACNGNVVSISGVDNTVVISGRCSRVEVSGMDNSVTVDAADAIEASGMNNKITFHSGSPRIDKSGFSNTVEQG
jgi:hypothetical protein